MASNQPPSGQDASGGRAPPSRPPPAAPAPTPGTAEQVDAQDRPRTKPEGSSYASSYRPSQPPIGPRPASSVDEHYGFSNAPIDPAEASMADHPPPAYTELPGQISDDSSDLGANAIVAEDGRVNIRINQKSRRLSQLLTPQIQRQISRVEEEPAPPPPYIPEFLGGAPGQKPPPPLNVVIHVVGSRGDVQPFVALGKVLVETYKHRVRLATHPTFKDFVTENGLEFFSIGGDPAELMAFMVKNPGLMPGFDTLRSGDVGQRRRGIAEILRGTWRSCIETGDGLGIDPLKQSIEEWMEVENGCPEALKKPFVADAIIANPPSFGHIHCAEKLGIPLHMMFTMPWSPTQQFPHPLANIQSSNADPSITNFMSYTLVDMLTWQGLGDVINKFRKDSLGLDPISMIWAPGMLARMKIPYTYCWSPALIPKPKDWGHHISIAGFYFLSLASNYTPAPDLKAFLDAGEHPVYIGFGSIVVDDPNAMTKLIFEAVKKTGVRALVSKGWGGLGADELGLPEGVFMLGNVPHDWLFKHVSAVVHHGGAGTTAAGIAAGRPTVVVPFFGDQPFWGAMTAKAGAGPHPIPYKELTGDKLAEAIQEALRPESLERAQELSEKIRQEQGGQNGAQYFHQMLKYEDLRCMVAPTRAAVWRVKRTQVKLSAMAATVLAQEGELNFNELKVFRPREYETDDGPWDPITGGATAIIGTATTMMMGVADFPIETMKLLGIHPESKKGKSAQGSQAGTSTPESRIGRPTDSRSTTNTRASASSSASTLPGVNTPLAELPTGSADDVTPSRHSSSSEISRVTSPTGRSSFMAQAMRASTQVSHTRSRSASPCPIDRFRHNHSQSQTSSDSRSAQSSSNTKYEHPVRSPTGTTFGDRIASFNPEAAVHTGKGLQRIVGAGFKSPMEFTLNVAKGFHNVPKLYGGSGVRTAAKELGLGFYEGMTGLVTDPYKGAKKEGAAGFVKGIARGIAGVPLRVMGGVFAFPGYAMKGLYQEALKEKGAAVQNYIIAARISQGYDEAMNISASERADILTRWRCIRLNVKKKKNPGEEQIEALHTLMKERRQKRQDRWNKFKTGASGKSKDGKDTRPPMSNDSSYSDLPEVVDSAATFNTHHNGVPLQHAHTFPQPNPSERQLSREQILAAEEEAERLELEAAIAESVRQTSHGNPEEDELIARAIRASVAELDRPIPSSGAVSGAVDESEEEALQRAMRASISEAVNSGATEEEQRVLEETLRRSLLETGRLKQTGGVHGSSSEWDSGEDTEDDEEFQRIVAESKELAHLQGKYPEGSGQAGPGAQQDSGVVGSGENADDDEALKKVIEESEKADKERMEQLERQKTEEDIVLEYVKKQSLAEEELRRKMMQGRGGPEGLAEGESSKDAAGSSK
ncbi:hypothetical protein BCR34DRAFT_594746 [Clohesyomyces aquaticus]|uniref:Uncharacterized protein n=1 Tax=Clohesyomyces aquaticus TaxID=1231657 RepID=A0A1Y1Y675_9PLEO|nr:hypothetical protein BCR34DRAFT_594746 [Clohesyomyces aquaticus]